MNLNWTISAILTTLVVAASSGAVIQQRWSVTQNDVVVSWAWPDINGDGVQELLQEDGLGTWFLDGSAGYVIVWEALDPSPTTNGVFGLWLQRNGWFVFRQQNTTDQQARLYVFQTYGTSPVWSTVVLPGNITEGGIGDFDGDGQLELAYSWHNWSGTAWTSNWTVNTLATGAVELATQNGAGYLSGPWPGNIEGDDAEELVLNWYMTNGSAQLVCWGAPVVSVGPALQPLGTSLRAWPNPFNPVCRIQLTGTGALPESVGIFNLAGAELRRLPLRGTDSAVLIWDGLDQRGRQVASGTYLVRAGDQTLPVTLIK